MNGTNDFDRRLADWLEADGAQEAPAGLATAAVAATQSVGQLRSPLDRLVTQLTWPPLGLPSDRLRPVRRAGTLALMAVLALAGIASAIYVGSRLLEQRPVVTPLTSYLGVMEPVGALIPEGFVPAVATLADGTIFVVSSHSVIGRTVSIWDPATGQLRDVGPSPVERSGGARLTPLHDGRILVVGGELGEPDPFTGERLPAPATPEVFDPVTGTFRPVAAMTEPGIVLDATTLTDGRVLVTGVASLDDPEAPAFAEVYDPATDTFTALDPETARRLAIVTLVLADGRLLTTGMWDGNGPTPALEIYDPVTGDFSGAATLPTGSGYPVAVLDDGRVVLAATACSWTAVPFEGRGGSEGRAPAATQLYDPSAGTLAKGPTLPHCVDTAVPLPNGQLLLTGWWYEQGADGGWNGRGWSGLYDPATDATRVTAAPRQYRSAVAVLADGRVLLVGGQLLPEGEPTLIEVTLADGSVDQMLAAPWAQIYR